MSVPKTKNELIQQSQENYKKLFDFIDAVPAEMQLEEFPPGTMNRNIRDVLAHLHHWHLMFLGWHAVGMKGQKPEMLAKGYSWKDTKALNKAIWEKYSTHPLEEVKRALNKSHAELQAIIEKHADTELFEKKRYPWTGSSSLATYMRGATSSHYNWAHKLVKKGLRNQANAK